MSGPVSPWDCQSSRPHLQGKTTQRSLPHPLSNEPTAPRTHSKIPNYLQNRLSEQCKVKIPCICIKGRIFDTSSCKCMSPGRIPEELLTLLSQGESVVAAERKVEGRNFHCIPFPSVTTQIYLAAAKDPQTIRCEARGTEAEHFIRYGCALLLLLVLLLGARPWVNRQGLVLPQSQAG